LNARIHVAINEAAANPLLVKAYKEINARVQSLRFRTNQNKSRWQQAVREHEEMVQALETRDAAAMRRILIEHLLHKRDTVVELLRHGAILSPPTA
jgi:DNA-binding GntR family transcriptional regulator